MEKKTSLHYGLIIKQLIRKKGYDVEDAANRIGVSRTYLQTVFNKKDINTSFARKVATGLNIPIESVLVHSYIQTEPQNQTFVSEPVMSYQREKDRLEIEYLKRENELLREMIKKQ